MRNFFIVFLLGCLKMQAQSPELRCKQVYEIAAQERIHHEGLNIIGGTLSSANFDVKYYRCEWEVDPAAYYIAGKVTVYFVITSSANSISFDLMNSMNVDSVKQRNTVLAKNHNNN